MSGNDLILMADDDPDDCELTLEALRLAGIDNPVEFVADGVELVDYLKNSLKRDASKRKPSLVFLDLNMPRMSGHAALRAIKDDPAMADIPIVILTTTKSESEIAESYRLGAHSFISKGLRLQEFIESLQTVSQYWLHTAKLAKS